MCERDQSIFQVFWNHLKAMRRSFQSYSTTLPLGYYSAFGSRKYCAAFEAQHIFNAESGNTSHFHAVNRPGRLLNIGSSLTPQFIDYYPTLIFIRFQLFLSYLFIAESYQSENPINVMLMISFLFYCGAVSMEIYLLSIVCWGATIEVHWLYQIRFINL